MILSLVFALIISLVVTRLLVSNFLGFNALDLPGERSLHLKPTPRLGGMAICAGIISGWLVLVLSSGLSKELICLGGAASLIALVSAVDDFLSLSQVGRFIIHLLATAIIIAGTVFSTSTWLAVVFYGLATVWLINLYNFMDGMDGFSGGMAVIGFFALGLAAWLSGADIMAQLIWVVSISALGFLCFNLPPARIFMGDVGSTTLGFLVAGFSLWGVKDGIFSIWLPLLIFSPFIVDASLTILRRAINREKIWLPHRKHFYQRLVLNGWSHRQTVLCEYLLMLACASSALIMQRYNLAVHGLTVWFMIYTILAVLVERKVRDKVPF